jgi:hypothetical protein
MTYNFFLSDQTSEFDGLNYVSQMGEGGMYSIGKYLEGFFDEICQLDSCPFDSSDFTWNPPASAVSGMLLIYFVNSQASSLVRQVIQGKELGDGGTTFVSPTGNLSEVYFTFADQANDAARALAIVAFHEAMHNLLQLNNSLHDTGGGGLAAKQVRETTRLTDRNKQLIAPVMGNNIPQNTSFL